MKTVLILSWWMDSTTVLYKLISEWKEVYPITFFYWQRHKKEIDFAQKSCEKLWILEKHKVIDISNITDLISNSALTWNIEVPEWHYEQENMKLTVVPNRNSIMSNIAIWYAVNIWANELALWVHSWDHQIYPDCRPEFIKALQELANIANYEKINIYTPYLYSNKTWIIKEWLELWVDYSLTRTCYKWLKKACWVCWSCVERLESFQNNWINDPLIYEQK